MAHRDSRGEKKEVLKFKSHYFLEEGWPQGILPSITNCGEVISLYIMRLSSRLIKASDAEPLTVNSAHPFARVILFFNILRMLFLLSALY